jgi:ABC-type Fe3+-citrate transport system substrate-binding protein
MTATIKEEEIKGVKPDVIIMDDLTEKKNRKTRRSEVAWKKGEAERTRKWKIRMNLRDTKAEGRKIQRENIEKKRIAKLEKNGLKNGMA